MQGVIQGETVPQMAKRLESVADMDHRAAIRNARTMVTGAQNAGRIDAAKRAKNMGIGITNVWMATLDMRTRHEHRVLDGQRREVDDPFEVEGQKIRFPGDPEAAPQLVYNCRCTLIPQVKGFEYDIRGGDSVDYSALEEEGLDYEAWKKSRVEKPNPITLPEEKAAAIKGSYINEYKQLRKKTLEKSDKNDTIDSEDPLPKSLEHFAKYEFDWRNTHYNEYSESQKEFVRQKLQEVFDNGEYHMAIKADSLSKVMQSGRFMNQLETGTSGGVLTENGRKTICANLFGADVDKMQPRDFEKYGYLGHRDFAKDAKEATALSPDYNGGYGSVIVRFKKQALNNRVTYTANDSYGGALAGTQIAGHDGRNVSISGIETFERTQRNMLNTLMFASEEQLHNPNSIAHAAGGSYFELQYHGDISIKDVASVCFTDNAPPQIVNELKTAGIKTFKVEGMNVIEL